VGESTKARLPEVEVGGTPPVGVVAVVTVAVLVADVLDVAPRVGQKPSFAGLLHVAEVTANRQVKGLKSRPDVDGAIHPDVVCKLEALPVGHAITFVVDTNVVTVIVPLVEVWFAWIVVRQIGLEKAGNGVGPRGQLTTQSKMVNDIIQEVDS